MPEQISQIVFCPCCNTVTDAIAEDGTTIEFECVSCEQKWTMEISKARFDSYSIA